MKLGNELGTWRNKIETRLLPGEPWKQEKQTNHHLGQNKCNLLTVIG